MSKHSSFKKRETITAILVDGGFYRKRARYLFGEKTPKDRADELYSYCMRHLSDKHENRCLYRIFYYDCPPSDKNVYNPLTGKNLVMKKSPEYAWMKSFLEELKRFRKLALRMGVLSDSQLYYYIKPDATKRLLNGKISAKDLSESDMELNIEQKGVDMRIGIDISALSFKKQVDQIILISGDSDFVPAAKQARREGIDFILDPMKAKIKDDLFEHIDGIRSPIPNKMLKKS